ncbi:hypothetical protein PKOR_16465 [Pontibacter korlensis]|uniref:Uncharacterized protein n=1 Tax=Pontibacter korlensis TaxID=400092 RepID=A0A0E3ZI26_9BACT|nr:hypothetical protein PKOR_16465 [Pontibacter korlensis]
MGKSCYHCSSNVFFLRTNSEEAIQNQLKLQALNYKLLRFKQYPIMDHNFRKIMNFKTPKSRSLQKSNSEQVVSIASS